MQNLKLYEARKSKGISQLGLAVTCGMKANTMISFYERYGIVPTWRVAKKIAAVLDVDVRYLWPTIQEVPD